MNIKDYMQKLGKRAKQAARKISKTDSGHKNKALLEIAKQLRLQSEFLMTENKKDLKAGQKKGLDAALLDRLELTPERITAMIEGLEQIVTLADPIGEINGLHARPSGIEVGKMRVPIGVIG
ncbi:MAG: gamma-glutamyl-phosphate reductase, partial [Methylococcales bacterium]|nr:gamma-glutamyl-phosphate reductase [Methylococcales bacterium]